MRSPSATRGRKYLVREIRADFVLCDHLRGNAQDVRRRTIIFGQGYAKRGRILSRLPACEPFQKQFEASERSATKPVNGLIVVAHHHDVARLGGKQMQQLQLRDIGVLKFIHQNVLDNAAGSARGRVASFRKQRDRPGN